MIFPKRNVDLNDSGKLLLVDNKKRICNCFRSKTLYEPHITYWKVNFNKRR